jgi:uncharacterized cupredoxin-like copper-binding protein
MTRFRFGLLALSALLATGTWVAVSTHSAAAQGAATLAVALDDYRFWHDVTAVPAGEVTFDLKNVGDEVHELIVIKSDIDTAALPPSAIRGEVDEAVIGEYIGGWEDVQPGAVTSGTLTLLPGRYILLCNLTDHYTRGMVSTLQVD